MRGIIGGEYRDETRIVHMLQALERIVHETSETSLWDAMTKDVPALLPKFRDLVAALPPNPDAPDNIGEFL